MTLISVGSTGTKGNPLGTHGTTPGDGAAPTGFEKLLAGAQPAHEPGRESVRETESRPRGDRPCDAPENADDTDAADGSAPADGTDDTTKPDAPTDPFGLVAAQAAAVPMTPVTPVPTTDTTATGADAAPVTDATTIVPDPTVLVDGAGDETPPPPTAATVDLTEILNSLSPDDASPAPDPVPLPLPDLPVTPARTAPAPTAVARETFAPAASERARLAPSAPPAPSGAATFAAPPPPPVTAAMANVAIEESAAAGRTAPPPPSEQLVSVLTPLRNTQNGTYTLRLELKPPELGRIEMRVEIREGVLHASIHAEQHNSAQVLRDALADLRERLSSEGVHTGDLTVSDGSVGSRQHASGRSPESRAARPDVTTNDATDLPETIASAPTSETDGTSLLDVRV